MPILRRRAGRPRRIAGPAAALALLAPLLAGCGAGSAGGGPVTLNLYSPPDDSGAMQAAADRCSEESNGAYRIAYHKLPKAADDQRQQLVRRLAARDASMDVLGLDVVWPPEFAEAGWIREWTGPHRRQAEAGTLAIPLQTATWRGRLYAVPSSTNVQLLWYRRDLVPTPPRTWDQMISMAEALAARGRPHHIEVTGAQYEGLTVWFNTLVRSAGGGMLTPDGRSVALGRPARDALAMMRRLATSTAADPSLANTMEDQARLAMEGGRAAFELNWPYVWASMQQNAPPFAGQFGWAPYPRMSPDEPSRVTVGGVDLGVSTYARHPDLAFRAALCLRDEANQKRAAVVAGLPPTLESLYRSTDPQFTRAYPFARELLATLQAASSRPQTPAYQTLSINVSDALSPPSSISPERTERDLAARLNASLRSTGLIP